MDNFACSATSSLLTACPEILAIVLVFEKFLDLFLWFRLAKIFGCNSRLEFEKFLP